MANTQTNPQPTPALPQALLGSNTTSNTLFQVAWLIIRVAAGGLMIHNGLDKLADVQGFADNVVSYLGFPYPVFFTYCAAYAELIGAGFVILGLLTRLSAGMLLVTMAVAIAFHLKSDGLQVPPLETASLYAAIYAFLLVNGPGQWSLDEWIAKQLKP